MNGYVLFYYCHPDFHAEKIGDECPVCGKTEVFVRQRRFDFRISELDRDLLMFAAESRRAIFNHFAMPKNILGRPSS